jgi:hypothetical protein
MEVVPKDVAFATAALTSMNRNRFAVETSGATNAGPSSIVTITLPSNSLIDLKTLRIKMDLTTTSDVTSGGNGNVYAKLPADVSSLISSVETYIGGVQVDQSCAEYSSLCRILKIVRCSRDRDGSVDRLLSHGSVTVNHAVDNVSVVLQDFKGFLGESSTRYLPTNLTGDITIRLTLAPTSVLTFIEQGVAAGGNFSGGTSRTKAAALTYSASNIRATVDTISMGSAYDAMLMQRLETEEFLPVNFRSYYTFSLHGSTSNAHSLRFSLSASSVDACYAVMRDGNYMSNGIKLQSYVGANLADAHCSNALFFKSFNSSDTLRGDLRYKWTVANVSYPQFSADILDAAADVSLVTNQVHTHDRGHMITSLAKYGNGMCVIPLVLNLPGNDLNVSSGYNTKGGNVSFSFEVSGLTPPTVNATSQTSDQISTFVVAETTAQLRIMGMKSVVVSF